MERCDVILSLEADADIRDIVHYIAERLRQPDTAVRMRERIYREIFSLDFMPERYALVSDERLARRGYRVTSAGQYLIFYCVEPSGRTVNILRVLYGRSDWAAVLLEA